MTKLRFDPDDLTLGELEEFETVTGKPLDEVMSEQPVIDADGKPVRDKRGRPVRQVRMSMKEVIALMWLIRRRDEPGFTLDDARKLRVADLNELELVQAGDPKANGHGPVVRPSPKSAFTTS